MSLIWTPDKDTIYTAPAQTIVISSNVNSTLVSGSWGNLGFSADILDDDNWHDTAVNQERFIANRDCTVLSMVNIYFPYNNQTGIREIRFKVNDVFQSTSVVFTADNYVSPTYLWHSIVVSLSQNDYLSVAGYQSSGVNLPLSNGLIQIVTIDN